MFENRKDYLRYSCVSCPLCCMKKVKGKIVGVFSGKEEEQVYQYAFRRQPEADMRELSKAMNSELNGRGGGSELMAQGTFKAGEKEIREVLIREAGKLE